MSSYTVKELRDLINNYKSKNCPSNISSLKKDDLLSICQKLKIGPFLAQRDPHEEIGEFPKRKLSEKQLQKKIEEVKQKKVKLNEDYNNIYDKVNQLSLEFGKSKNQFERDEIQKERNRLIKRASKILESINKYEKLVPTKVEEVKEKPKKEKVKEVKSKEVKQEKVKEVKQEKPKKQDIADIEKQILDIVNNNEINPLKKSQILAELALLV